MNSSMGVLRKGLHLTSVPVFEIIQAGSGEGCLPYLKRGSKYEYFKLSVKSITNKQII